MQGVGRPTTRARIAAYGPIGLICVPFVRVTRQRVNLRALRREVVRVPGTSLSVQLMGSHAPHLAIAAEELSAAGADVVDLNLGCPVRGVVRKGVGAALLDRPHLVSELIARMRERVTGLLSVKLRAGYAAPDRALEIASRAEAAGADFVVIHPRSRAEGYQGVANWRIVAEAKRALRIPVIGNGDCWYAADALRLMQQTGCDGVMLGRAALRNPWIFQQVNDLWAGKTPCSPNGDEVLEHIRRLASDLGREARRTPQNPLGGLKEHVRWLLRTVPEGPRNVACVLAQDNWTAMQIRLGELFGGRSSATLDLHAEPVLGLERSATVD
jgi:tRNA-dihydrouridine synthase B